MQLEWSCTNLHEVEVIPCAPFLNHSRTVFELPLLSLIHLSAFLLCLILSLHHHPAKPDNHAAYQAFCQPGRVIILSKYPPAFCLPPPPQKPPEAGTHCPLLYLSSCLAFNFSILSIVFHVVCLQHVEPYCFLIAWFMKFFSQRVMATSGFLYLVVCRKLVYLSCAVFFSPPHISLHSKHRAKPRIGKWGLVEKDSVG